MCYEENEQEVSRDVEQGWGGARDCGPAGVELAQSYGPLFKVKNEAVSDAWAHISGRLFLGVEKATRVLPLGC